MTHDPKPMTPFWRIGHRGACGHAPENTLLSMRKALSFGVDAFEFDIRLSKDGEPVVIHDDTLARTTNGTGFVADYTRQELAQFDAGQGEAIAAFDDVLEMVYARTRLLIELKDEGAEIPVAERIKACVARGSWRYEQLIVCSFDHNQIAAIRRIDPDVITSALLVGIPVTLAQLAEEAGAWSINPAHLHCNRALVKDAHKRGLKVFAWTANEPAHIASTKALGVDGIISDYPDRL